MYSMNSVCIVLIKSTIVLYLDTSNYTIYQTWEQKLSFNKRQLKKTEWEECFLYWLSSISHMVWKTVYVTRVCEAKTRALWLLELLCLTYFTPKGIINTSSLKAQFGFHCLKIFFMRQIKIHRKVTHCYFYKIPDRIFKLNHLSMKYFARRGTAIT